MKYDAFDAKQARRLRVVLGRVCAAGQHAACASVGDPYDDEAKGEPVWVCGCECHGLSEQSAAISIASRL